MCQNIGTQSNIYSAVIVFRVNYWISFNFRRFRSVNQKVFLCQRIQRSAPPKPKAWIRALGLSQPVSSRCICMYILQQIVYTELYNYYTSLHTLYIYKSHINLSLFQLFQDIPSTNAISAISKECSLKPKGWSTCTPVCCIHFVIRWKIQVHR